MTQEEKVIHIDNELYNTILPAIKTQLESKRVTVPSDTDLIERIGLIGDIVLFEPSGDAVESDVVAGKTFYNNSTTKKTGTLTKTAVPEIFNISAFATITNNTQCIFKQRGDYMYIAYGTTGTLIKVNIATQEVVATASTTYGGIIKALDFDADGNVYIAGTTTRTIKKYDSDLNLLLTSASTSFDILTLAVYGNYAYIMNYGALVRYSISTLVLDISGTTTVKAEPADLQYNNGYLYCMTSTYVYQFNLDCTLAVQSAYLNNLLVSTSSSWVRKHLAFDNVNGIIWAGGYNVYKLDMNGLINLANVQLTDNLIQISINGEYIYGAASGYVYEIKMSDLSYRKLYAMSTGAILVIDKIVYFSAYNFIGSYSILKGDIGKYIVE